MEEWNIHSDQPKNQNQNYNSLNRQLRPRSVSNATICIYSSSSHHPSIHHRSRTTSANAQSKIPSRGGGRRRAWEPNPNPNPNLIVHLPVYTCIHAHSAQLMRGGSVITTPSRHQSRHEVRRSGERLEFLVVQMLASLPESRSQCSHCLHIASFVCVCVCVYVVPV